MSATLDCPVETSTQAAFASLKHFLSTQVMGQTHLIERLMMALLTGGHLLVEGPPGLAKTRAVKALSQAVDTSFKRLQFTPDLLPSDLTGTDIFRPEQGQFEFQKGPLFNNMILADEINRAPAKVQSALLEAMAEQQISVGQTTYALPKLFLVMATQNSIEQEGTYPLPEAQLDRFIMHVNITYPDAKTERQILRLSQAEEQQTAPEEIKPVLTPATVFAARQEILKLHLAEPLETYMIELVMATRSPERYDRALAPLIRYGASPRGTLSLDRSARARAWLQGRDYVSPEDIQAVLHDVLRHRILTTFEADAQGIDSDKVLSMLLDVVPVP